MLTIANQQQIQEYYEKDALSQSFLKKLSQDLSKLTETPNENAEHLVFGKLVDSMLLSSVEDFNATYHISKIKNLPSEAMQAMIKKLVGCLKEDFDEFMQQVDSGSVTLVEQDELFPNLSLRSFVNYCQPDISAYSESYIKAITEEFEWNSKWGLEAKTKAFSKENDYYLDLIEAEGKTVISESVFETAKAVATSLRTHPRTARFFDVEAFASNQLVEVYYQFPIYFSYRGHECKALLDIVIIEYTLASGVPTLNTITPVDLKTMNGNTYYFPKQVSNFQYFIQAAWYTLALKKRFEVSELQINPFMFVVESSTKPGKPLCFTLTEDTIHAGREGARIGNKEYKGFDELIDLYEFYKQNGFTEEPEIVEAQNSPLLINLEGYVKNDY